MSFWKHIKSHIFPNVFGRLHQVPALVKSLFWHFNVIFAFGSCLCEHVGVNCFNFGTKQKKPLKPDTHRGEAANSRVSLKRKESWYSFMY